MADVEAAKSVTKALCDGYNNGGPGDLGNFYTSDAILMAHGLEKLVGREGNAIIIVLTKRVIHAN